MIRTDSVSPASRCARRASEPFLRNLVGVALLLAIAPVAAEPGAFQPRPFPIAADGAAAVDVLLARGLVRPNSWDVFVVNGNSDTESGEVAQPDRLYSCCVEIPGAYVVTNLSFDEPAEAGVAAAMADFNGDSLTDIVVAGGETDSQPAPSRIYLRRASGNGFDRFQVGDVEASTAIATGDWDGDGDVDVAIARRAAEVDLLRNDTPVNGSTPVFTAVQSLSMAFGPVKDVALGSFGPGTSLSLVVLRERNSANPGAEPGVLHFASTGGVQPFSASGTLTPLPDGDLTQLGVGNFDGDEFDDLVVAARTAAGALEGASRVLHGAAAVLAIDAFRFPPESQDTVAVADFNGDELHDVVFGKIRCPVLANCSPFTGSTLSMWLRTTSAFVSNAQCLGGGTETPVAVAAGPMFDDDLPDVFVLASGGIGSGWWSNNAPVTFGQCCVVEAAANDPPQPAASALLRGTGGPADVQAFARLRDGIMADAIDGPRLISRYATFSPYIVGRMIADPTLLDDAATVIRWWSPGVRALVDGDGAAETVSAGMIDAVDDFLVRLSGAGNPALTQVIAEERAQLPPFASLVGLDMDEFRDAVLPTDVTFGDGFE